MYLTFPGHPTDTDLQLGSLLSMQQVRVVGDIFISSVSSLSFIFLSTYLSFISLLPLFSLYLGDNTK